MLGNIIDNIIRIVSAILEFISSRFHRPEEPDTPGDEPSVPDDTPAYTVPFPKEPENPTATLDNTDLQSVIASWMVSREVPVAYRLFWTEGVKIQLSYQYPYAAASAETLRVWVNPVHATPGVVAHECAHISYRYLSDDDRIAWASSFDHALVHDCLLKFVSEKEPYMLHNYIEAHAEVYRYLGPQMPKELKRFYPKLI